MSGMHKNAWKFWDTSVTPRHGSLLYKMQIAGAVVTMLAWSSFASTIYVDAANFGKAGLDGTDGNAYGTIQEAVDHAASGDTIRVRPGIYDKGEPTFDGFGKCRVVIIGKNLILEATEGRETTVIVGQHSTSGRHDDTAIRCVYADTSGTELRGFTLRGGDTAGDVNSALGSGGGLWAGAEDVRLVDCGIIDCWGTRGCGMFNGTAIRCVFAGCKKYGTSGGTGAICRNSRLYCCIATGCDLDGLPGLDNCLAVNCTFFGNYNGTLNSRGCMINCISVNSGGANGLDGGDSDGNVEDLQHSVFGDKTSISTTQRSYGLNGVVLDAPIRQFLAPALGDFRLISGSVAATNGNADVMFYLQDFARCIPQSERYLDFNKKPIAQSGQIAAGAIQEAVEKPNCGAVTFNVSPQVFSAWGKIKVFGCPVLVSYYYAYPERYPGQIHLPRDMFAGTSEHIYAYRLGNVDSSLEYRPPEMDDSFWAMPSSNSEEDLHVSGVWASGAYYVNPSTGIDDVGRGLTIDTPFKTLKYAVAAVPDTAGLFHVIYAAEGNYDATNEGSSIVAGDHNNRVAVTSANKVIRFKGAGRDKSIIEGAIHSGGQYGGCGSTAARCFYAAGACVLQGFTLKNGFAGWDGSTANKDLSRAGGVFLNSGADSLVADCMVTNCAAERAGAGWQGRYVRCMFADCLGNQGGMRGVRFCSSCSFVNCPGTGGAPFLYNDNPTMFRAIVCHCSFYGDKTAPNQTYGGLGPTWNTALLGGSSFREHRNDSQVLLNSQDGNVISDFDSVQTSGNYSPSNPEFVSSTDLRPFAGSPVFVVGARPDSNALSAYLYNRYATTDIDGRPLAFNSDGIPVVGCYQVGVNALKIVTPDRGTISPATSCALEPGETVTVTYTRERETRPYRGISVNGEIVTNGTSVTITAPMEGEMPESFRVEVPGTAEWYVNANADDDSGNGFTPETAKKTMRAIMACDLLAGDIVHAARGDYAEGETSAYRTANATGLTASRVEIPSGVTLVADEGPDVTVIHGKKGTGADAQYGYGGTGPVRCAVLNENSVLKGFTLMDGHAASASGASSDTEGGGVYAFATSGKVCDCIITNCSAPRCGGVAHATAINCRIVGNASSGFGYGSAGGFADLIGCYLGPQQNDNGAYRAPGRVEFCTFDGASVSYGIQGSATKCCVFKNLMSAISGTTQFQGCTFDESSWTLESGSSDFRGTFDGACTHVQDLKLGVNGVPEADSPVVNVGNNGYVPAELEDRDAAGNPRISNVTVDIGAFEHDWRVEFASALGRGVRVTEASAGVTLENGKVKLTDGASISGVWPAISTQDRMRYKVTVGAEGEGRLTGWLVSESGSIDKRFDLIRETDTCAFKIAGTDISFSFDFRSGGAGYITDFVQTPPPGTIICFK